MHLTTLDHCSACGGCLNICPRGCITMEYTSTGERKPVIDGESCVDCGLCVKVCPHLSDVELHEPATCYAAYRKDGEKRLDSASGGIGALLYETFLKLHANAAVYGVCWNAETERVVYASAASQAELGKFKGSKYVQPDVNDTYRAVGNDLRAGKPVLFVGLPCHVAACRRYLELSRISDQGLTCVDLLCHGVSSHDYFTQQLQWIKEKWNMDRVDHISFRNNRARQHFHLVIQGRTASGRPVCYDRFVSEDRYFRSFLDGVSLSESCYTCRFADSKRCSDITIGDFLGLGTRQEFPVFAGQTHNTSVVLLNSNKGSELFAAIQDQCFSWERPCAEAVAGGASLQKPFRRHPKRNQFLTQYRQRGFLAAEQRVQGRELCISHGKQLVKRAMKKLGLDTDQIKRMVGRT